MVTQIIDLIMGPVHWALLSFQVTPYREIELIPPRSSKGLSHDEEIVLKSCIGKIALRIRETKEKLEVAFTRYPLIGPITSTCSS